MIKTRRNIVIIGLIILLIIAIVGVSYAAFNYSKTGTKINSITTGKVTMTYTESDNVIKIDKALPTTDETGKVRLKEGEYFDFTVSSEIVGDININYEISAKDVTDSGARKIDGSNIKLYLTRLKEDGTEEELMSPETYNEEGSSNEYTGRPTGEMSLYQGSMNSSKTNKYRLRMYVDEKYNPQGDGGNLTFSIKINVYGKDGISIEPNSPELDSNMIAVRYNGNNWVKADSSTNNWYNYNKGEWANAVTVSADTRSTYQSASIGTEIDMEDIETMWVWIPRYSYSIGSENGTNYYGKKGDYLESTPTQALPGEIDIKFVSADTKDRGTAKYVVSSGIQDNSWYTPEAFTFGDKELSGIWVGKFETSSSNPSASNGGGNTATLDTMIKPNVKTWRNINISNAFNVSLKMNDEGNRYGFSSNIDTHMMKNDEWAVVSYLSQSKYGKLGNEDYTGSNKEVFSNKSVDYITGCSYGSPPDVSVDYGCKYTYEEEINGTGASTTGTIYGIYDMSGGSYEYVMGNYNDVIGNSGFVSMPEAKYYNKYISNGPLTACNGNECISHGLSETAGWYNDYQNMVSETIPWLIRGGYINNYNSGVFYFRALKQGNADIDVSFRLVLSIN